MNSTFNVRDDLIAAYFRHWATLRVALRRRTGSHELAEDALQETWLRLAALEAAPETIRDSRAFVLRVAGNIAIDLLRKENRHSARFVSDEDLMRSIADSRPSPEVHAIDRDQLRCLVLALAQLPPKPRAALLLSRCDGLPFAEIAVRLKVSESMIAKYLATALRHCRDHLRSLE